MKNKKKIYFVLVLLLFCVLGLSIAYAALSTTLNINFGNVTQSQQTWNIAFYPTGTVQGNNNSTGATCGDASVQALSINIGATTLSKPGEKCIWTFTVKNSGSLAAKLSGIAAVAPTSTYADDNCIVDSSKIIKCHNVWYTLASDVSGTALTTGSILNSNATKTIYVIAEYVDTDLAGAVNIAATTSAATEVTHSNAKFTIAYKQN